MECSYYIETYIQTLLAGPR